MRKATTAQVLHDLETMGNETVEYIGSETRDYSGRKISLEHYITWRSFTEAEKAELTKKYSNVDISQRTDGRGVIHILDKKRTTHDKYIAEGGNT